jgi:cyclomaltodextrinase
VSPKVSPRHSHAYDVRKPNEEDRGLQRMVVLLQMTYLGAPMVYYGDEAGMWGGDDPCDRMPMIWDDLQPYEPQASDPSRRPRQPDEVAVDQELLAFYKRAIALRREQGVFRHGACVAVETNDDAQFFSFRRTLGEATALVAFNRGKKEFRWQPPKLRPAAKLEILLSTVPTIESGPLPTSANDVLVLPPHSAVVVAER